MVLAACSLASGGGSILRGITDTAFPYANLSSVDMLEELSGYVVGTANPRFEALVGLWDVICNIDTGRITVGKNAGLAPEPDMQGSLRESKSSMTSDHSMVRVDEDVGGTTPLKGSVTAKADSVDVAFMDEVRHPPARRAQLISDHGSYQLSLWRRPYSTPVRRVA